MQMTIDIDLARRDTPGCAHVIHLNNAGAALMPHPVIDAVQSYFELETKIGGYETVRRRHAQIEAVYDSIASLINCTREEIAVVENATRAWDMAFYSIPFAPGDRILTCVSEYASNFIPYLQVCNKTGALVEVIPNDEYGQVSLQALEDMIDATVKLISITHVPTNGGLVNPAAGIGRIARENKILYLLDACQSVGQLPIDVDETGCDLLSATSRKFLRGPRGMGFLYVRRGLITELEPPFLDLHSAKWIGRGTYQIRADARRFENWECNYSAKVGLGAAVDYALELGLEATWKRVHELGESLRTSLSDVPGVTLHDLGENRCGIVSFSLAGRDPIGIRTQLEEQKINVSVANPEDTLLDMNQRRLRNFIRASVHYYNTEEELQAFCMRIEALGRKER
jgi:selenocysteine lyase/cysteine desulfurase